jgi:hypothetical protein
VDADGFRIFLASPSGLDQYRRAARETFEHVRLTIASPRAIDFDPIGWEDIPAGFGRPQGVINAKLDECNVLIGILGKQLGTPTGEAESGFVEEYERMAARARAGEPVSIRIYPLRLADEDLADPGDKLKSVLSFRDQLYRDVLVTEVGGVKDFALRLYRDLVALVLEADDRRRERGDGAAAPVRTSKRPSPEQEPADEAARQLKEILGEAASEVPGLPERFRTDQFALARLGLWLSTWEGWYFTNETYGVHQLNRLFRMRSEVALSPLEERHVLRAMCAQPQSAPGWGLVGYDEGHVAPELLTIATGDREDAARIGGFELLDADAVDSWLARDDVEVNRARVFETLDRQIGEQSDGVRAAIVAFAERMGGAEATDFLSRLAERDETRRLASTALIRLLAGERSELVFTVAADTDTDAELDDTTLAALSEVGAAAPVEGLELLAGARDRKLRLLAIRLLRSHGAGATAALEAQLEAPDDAVAVAAFQALCEVTGSSTYAAGIYLKLSSRESLKLSAELRRARDRTLATADLQSSLDWLDITTATAYQVLAEDRWEEFKDTVRSDLADRFENFAAESRAQFTARIGSEVVEALQAHSPQLATVTDTGLREDVDSKLVTQLNELLEGGEWNERVFARAALAGLALNGETQDAGLVRPWLDSEHRELKEAAALALGRVGTTADVAGLLELCRAERNDLYARAALQLSPGVSGAAVALVDSNDGRVALRAARHFCSHSSDLSEHTIVLLLHHPNGDVRRVGLSCALETHDDDGLQELLERYTASERYFYNVVVWLDRVLFGPGYLKERSRAELSAFAAEERPEDAGSTDGGWLRRLMA